MSQHDSDFPKSGVYEAALDDTIKKALDELDRSVYQPNTDALKDDDDRLLLLRAGGAHSQIASESLG